MERECFNLKQTISSLLSKEDTNVFVGLLEAITYYHSRDVKNMDALKRRENKKLKGDLWENFSKEWLIASGKYTMVWLYREVPPTILEQLKLHKKVDDGIDIICQTKTGYIAIQCKYRKKGKVPWKTLSTFVALCAVSGPYEQHIVFTNCTGVTKKLIAKTPKDKSICIGTLKATKREHWLKMAGTYTEHKLVDNAPTTKLSVEALREARLKHFA